MVQHPLIKMRSRLSMNLTLNVTARLQWENFGVGGTSFKIRLELDFNPGM